MSRRGTVYGIFHKEHGACCYIGSTVNFYFRLAAHKHNCKGTSKLPVYTFMRENGGFDAFEIRILEELEVDDFQNYVSLKLTAREAAILEEFQKSGEVLVNVVRPAAFRGGICDHGRVHYYCKECGGLGICEHGRIRQVCKECGGASVCEHKRQRQTCIECGGSNVCEHKRQRQTCKDCLGPEKYKAFLDRQKELYRIKTAQSGGHNKT